MAGVPVHAVGREAEREHHLAAVEREPAEPVEGAELVGRGRAVVVREGRVAYRRGELYIARQQERDGEDLAVSTCDEIRGDGDRLPVADDVVGGCGARVPRECIRDTCRAGGVLRCVRGAWGRVGLPEGVEGGFTWVGAEGLVVEVRGYVEGD